MLILLDTIITEYNIMKINYTSGCTCDSLTIDGKESADLSPKVIKNDIVNSLKTIEVYHPAYYARTGKKMPSSVFTDINQALKQQYNYQIEFYKETEYGTC